jgi:hypothetical protein
MIGSRTIPAACTAICALCLAAIVSDPAFAAPSTVSLILARVAQTVRQEQARRDYYDGSTYWMPAGGPREPNFAPGWHALNLPSRGQPVEDAPHLAGLAAQTANYAPPTAAELAEERWRDAQARAEAARRAGTPEQQLAARIAANRAEIDAARASAQAAREAMARNAGRDPFAGPAAAPVASNAASVYQPRLPAPDGYPTHVARNNATTHVLDNRTVSNGPTAEQDAEAIARNDPALAAIYQRSDEAMAAWERLASQIEYDEYGEPHWIDQPRPQNTFRPGDPPPSFAATHPGGWASFDLGDAVVAVADLEAIYAGWDIDTAPFGSSGRSLDLFPPGPSSVGWSMSSAGQSLALNWYLPGFGDSANTPDAAFAWLREMTGQGGMPLDWNALLLAEDNIRQAHEDSFNAALCGH